jgi:hypothetical protein
MLRRLPPALGRHPILATLVAAAALGCLVLLLSETAGLIRWWAFDRAVGPATSVAARGEPLRREWPVRFRRGCYAVAVHVYPSELESARRLDTGPVFSSDSRLQRLYVRSLVRAVADSRLVGEFADQLHAIKDRRSLDDDGYVELMSAAVQAIPYGTVRRRVLVLDSYDHVALGVASDNVRFRVLPYAFVETTRAEQVGECDPSYLGWGPIGSPPQVIDVGGTKRYRGLPRGGATG